jgi:beta-lysine 5,6-aminomutase alpha subunit
VRLLESVAERGLMSAIEAGTFADVQRPRDGGRGYDGVFAKDAAYWNPFADALAGDAVPA